MEKLKVYSDQSVWGYFWGFCFVLVCFLTSRRTTSLLGVHQMQNLFQKVRRLYFVGKEQLHWATSFSY